MVQRQRYTTKSQFYKEFHEINFYFILGLIIITLGTYIFHWIYLKNKEFLLLDSKAPDPNRGAVIMLLIPFSWFFLSIFINFLFSSGFYFTIIKNSIWILILLLIYKYLYDFTVSFGKITRTSGLLWFLMFIFSGVGFFGIIFNIWFLMIFFLFFLIIIPAMQAELNSHFSKFLIKKNSNIFYD